MEIEEIKKLAEKVKNSTSTPEEELALLKTLNENVEEFRKFIKTIMEEK